MKPTTFKEHLQRLFTWFLVVAGVAVGLGLVAMVLLLAYGGWPVWTYRQIISILGNVALGGVGIMALVILFLGLGGPARSLKVGFGRAEIEAQDDT